MKSLTQMMGVVVL